MANIKIGDTLIENASLTGSPSLTSPKVLGVSFATSMTLEELAALFSAEHATEIRMLDSTGATNKLFYNEKLTSLQVETVSAARHVSAAFLVTAVPVDEDTELVAKVAALETELAAVKADNEAMSEALEAIEEGIANA